ncbi:MAG: hypothetical protein AVDCRST_MAG54-1254, partial [uncultured Actinomycetospora sp.]
GPARRVLRDHQHLAREDPGLLQLPLRVGDRARPDHGGLRDGRHRRGPGRGRRRHRAIAGARRHGGEDLRAGRRPGGPAGPRRRAGRRHPRPADGAAGGLRAHRRRRRPRRQPRRPLGM